MNSKRCSTLKPVPGSHLVERNEIAARERRAKTVVLGRRLLVLVLSGFFLFLFLPSVFLLVPSQRTDTLIQAHHQQECGFLLKYCRSGHATEKLERRTAVFILSPAQ